MQAQLMNTNETQDPARQALSAILRDADGNGIPDILEGRLGADEIKNMLQRGGGQYKILVDGTEYTDLDDVPPEKRQKIEQSLNQIVKTSAQVGSVLKSFGIFRLFSWFLKRGQGPTYASSRPQYPRPHREESSHLGSRIFRWLLFAVAIGAVVYYALT